MFNIFRTVRNLATRLAILEHQVDSLAAYRHAVEAVIDHNGAFLGAGVACPTNGVGALGFNVVDPEASTDAGQTTYLVGATGTFSVWNEVEDRYESARFVNGICVSEEKVKR